MLKTIFKILIVIFVVGIIFVGVMWAMQPANPLGEKTASLKDGEKLDKAKGEASKIIEKVKLPLDKKEDEKKTNSEKQKKSLAKEDKVKKDTPQKQKNDATYKFPKELATDRLTYTLHIDAFLFKEFADELLDNLKRKKYPAYSVSVWGEKKQLWHAVRVGRYLDYETADKKLADLNLKERRSARIISLGTLEFFPTAYLEQEKNADEKLKNDSEKKKKETSVKNDKVNPKTNKNANS